MRWLPFVIVLAGCATPIEIPGTEGNTSSTRNNDKSNSVNATNATGADAGSPSPVDASVEDDLYSAFEDGSVPPPSGDAATIGDAAGDLASDAAADSASDGPDDASGDDLSADAVSPDGMTDALPDGSAADVKSD